MKRLCYDIETNGLMPLVDTIWCLVTVDSDTGEVKSFSDHDADLPSLAEGLEYLHTADILYGHNVIGYDNVVLRKITGWQPLDTQKIIDTWLLSLLVQYQRDHKHGLEGWGIKLKFPKIDWDEWDKYSKDMLNYCIRDVELNVKVYKELSAEAIKIIKKHPNFTKGMEVEMEFAKIESEIQRNGWKFDMDAAIKLLKELDDKMATIEADLEPLIGMQCIKTDGLEVKSPAWRKDGQYTSATVKHFGYTQESGIEERPIQGDYCRVSFDQGKVGQIEVVKSYLYSIGWVPDEWNFEKINGKFIKKSPKITESSLEKLGGTATTISTYYTLRSRQGILKGWIEAAKADSRLHGRMWTIGTPTFRCRHEVVANIPSVDTIYGPELRSLLVAEEGMSIVGADSSGNQMRGLCHYIGNDDFTNEVINGDVHQRNADALGVSRKLAKPFLYAFLFGGGAGKLGSILTGNTDAKVGAIAKEKFQNSIPGMKALTDKLESEFERTENIFGKGKGFIRGLDGRIVFVASKHQVLNYLLQTAEGVTCKAAIVYLNKKLKERNIKYYINHFYHDELCVVCKTENAEEVMQLSVEAFTEAPKAFGVMCMSGSAHAGENYARVH